MLQGRSRVICMIYHMFPGLDVYYNRSCTTYHNGRLGVR